MRDIDYNRLLNAKDRVALVQNSAAQRNIAIEETYSDCNGVQYRSMDGSGRHFQEIVCVAEDATLLATDCLQYEGAQNRQVVSHGDWVHIQFRLDGSGTERFSDATILDTPAKSCIIARYPENTSIERRISGAERWRSLCLFLSPKGLQKLLDASATDLPEKVSWIGTEGHLDFSARTMPLQPTMALAVNDIISCAYRGSARRAYMRAKSLELLSAVIHALHESETRAGRPDEKLSSSDLMKISLAWSVMTEDFASPCSLGDLARRTGLNRSKLAYGFKQVYGVSVRRFWREANLDRARKLLQAGNSSVTEIALTAGYSDPYSFTRAFTRKFGILPRDCKSR